MQEAVTTTLPDAHAPDRRGGKGFFDTPVFVQMAVLAVAFLPFTKALTLQIGFPLKIYEIVFSLAILIFIFYRGAVQKGLWLKLLGYVGFFWIVTFYSSLIGILEATPAANLGFRGGRSIDSMMRVGYLAFNIGVFMLAYHACLSYPIKITRAWFAGLILTFSYHFFTFVSVVITGDAFLLPGLERHQMGWLGTMLIPRSGTFEEGNFAGLYYLASLALALYARKRIFVVISILGIALTLSTSTYFGLLAFAIVYGYMKGGLSFKQLTMLAMIILVGGMAFFQLDIGSKFGEDAGSSGAVRLNESMTGIEIFKANPVIGVGLGGYGFLYDQFEWSPELSIFSAAEKHIPNNVYIELLSETGVIGLSVFLLFWWSWIGCMHRKPLGSHEFFAFGLAASVVFLAYPTFNITYLWCFLGMGLGFIHSKNGV